MAMELVDNTRMTRTLAEQYQLPLSQMKGVEKVFGGKKKLFNSTVNSVSVSAVIKANKKADIKIIGYDIRQMTVKQNDEQVAIGEEAAMLLKDGIMLFGEDGKSYISTSDVLIGKIADLFRIQMPSVEEPIHVEITKDASGDKVLYNVNWL